MFTTILIPNRGRIARRFNAAAKNGFVLAACLVVLPVLAQEAPPVRAVRSEQISGGVERPNGQQRARLLQTMPADAYSFQDGVYQSAFNRISLRVPRIGTEAFVDVREAVALARADGTPATTHLMFDPDGTQVVWAPDSAASAVVVTRMRDDRPKDADSVLGRLDGGPQVRAQLASRGVDYAAIQTRLGTGLQRVVRNRAHNDRFPYDLALLNGAATTTYGVTHFLVTGDSFLEFSQVFPCARRADAECRAAALQAMEAFVGGVTEFRSYGPSASR